MWNSLALTVENTAGITAKNVFVEIQSPPSWFKLESQKIMLKDFISRDFVIVTSLLVLEKIEPAGQARSVVHGHALRHDREHSVARALLRHYEYVQ